TPCRGWRAESRAWGGLPSTPLKDSVVPPVPRMSKLSSITTAAGDVKPLPAPPPCFAVSTTTRDGAAPSTSIRIVCPCAAHSALCTQVVWGTNRTIEGSAIRMPNRDAYRSRVRSGPNSRTSTTTRARGTEDCPSLITPGVAGVELAANWALVVEELLLQPATVSASRAPTMAIRRMLLMRVLLSCLSSSSSLERLRLAVDEVVHHHHVPR